MRAAPYSAETDGVSPIGRPVSSAFRTEHQICGAQPLLPAIETIAGNPHRALADR